MRIIVTGGLGFIGSSIIRKLLNNKSNKILNIDKKTSVSINPNKLKNQFDKRKYKYVKLDICNEIKLNAQIKIFKPDVIIHAAAESHVDNSIKTPKKFIKSNIIGTYNLLEAIRGNNLVNKTLFLYISTDEVFGSTSKKESFSENYKFYPNSPYSASKASSDNLVRAWNRTFNIKTITTNCCNNYGPYQFPEKLIPLTIKHCLYKKKIPIYGNGKNVREWIHVDDHSEIIIKLIKCGKIGDTYNIGSGIEITNIDLVKIICTHFNKIFKNQFNYLDLIEFVKDRKGHDFRYSISNKKLINEIGKFKFKKIELEIFKTIKWYINFFNAK